MIHKNSSNADEIEITRVRNTLNEVLDRLKNHKEPNLSEETRREIQKKLRELQLLMKGDNLHLPRAALEENNVASLNAFISKNHTVLQKKFKKYQDSQMKFRQVSAEIYNLQRQGDTN